MKIILKCFLMVSVLMITTNIHAQVGIGTTTPDASSILDIYSNTKGLLMPRLTTTERDEIASPATGLMIYNLTSNDGQINTGTPAIPSWVGLKRAVESIMFSVTEDDYTTTTSTEDILISGMTLSPSPGTYLALFNGQVTDSDYSVPHFTSDQGVIDVGNIYETLSTYSGGVSHIPVFGNGETLEPGVYNVGGAGSISGTLTLNGGSATANPVFIIICGGAFTTGTNTTIVLTGNAKPENIFWVAATAISTGDPSTISGTLISGSAAIALGANTNLSGRMLTKAGALTMGANCVVTTPTEDAPIDLGVLSTFAMFTSSGAVSDSATSTIYGDVGTAVGALTISGTHVGEEYPAGTTDNAESTISTTTFSMYQNGVMVPNSNRTIKSSRSVISLQTVITVTSENNPLEIRWKYNTEDDADDAKLDNRTLTLIRSEY